MCGWALNRPLLRKVVCLFCFEVSHPNQIPIFHTLHTMGKPLMSTGARGDFRMFRHTMQELLKNFFHWKFNKIKTKKFKAIGAHSSLGSVLSFQFCDVVEVAIFHNLIWPNLAIKILKEKILICFWLLTWTMYRKTILKYLFFFFLILKFAVKKSLNLQQCPILHRKKG
jgi:hypothetical protein